MGIDRQAAENALAALRDTLFDLDTEDGTLARDLADLTASLQSTNSALAAQGTAFNSSLQAFAADFSKKISDLDAKQTALITDILARLTKLEGTATPAPAPATTMKLGAPFYCSPDTSTSTRWATLLAKGPTKIGLAVFNPSTGPTAVINQAYVTQVAKIKAAGIKCGVYIPTGYFDMYGYGSTLTVSADGVKRDPANVQNILDEIKRAMTWYPCDAVFLDEMNTKTADATVFATAVKIRDFIKNTYGAKVYWNPGTGFLENAIPLGDGFMRFEGDGIKYRAFVPPTWHVKYPGMMWDCVYAVPAADMQTTLAQAKLLKPALLWMTDDIKPNPYDANPSYLDSLCAAL